MRKSSELLLGLDIGGTNIKTVILSSEYVLRSQFETPSNASLSPQSVRDSIRSVIEHAITSHGHIDKIGIGCAGSVNTKTGVVINSPNFQSWNNIPLSDWVRQDTGLGATIKNDTNCATIAEWKLGAGRGYRNLVLLTFGTGIGGGFIINDVPYTGTTGSAAEFGHMTIKYDGIPCPCGNIGCFERYVSASALKNKIPGLTAQEIFAQSAHDETSRMETDQFFHALRAGLTGIANAFDPECILIGGGLAPGIAPRLAETSHWVKTHCFPSIAEKLVIKTCELNNWAGAIGAALQSEATDS